MLSFFVALDLAAKELSIPAYTLISGTSFENDYKAHATLSTRLSRSFHIEAAQFGTRLHQHCLFGSSKAAAAFTSTNGVVVSWCTRQKLRRMFQVIGSWWLNLGKRSEHIIVPVSASVLNLFRSDDFEFFPWDADIDANFIASHPIVLGSFLKEHEEELFEMGYDYILKGERVVYRDMADSVRMDIWITGPQEVELYDIRARFCGLPVRFFKEQISGLVWYYRPGEKIYGKPAKFLHCKWAGHNACLPDCLRGGRGVGNDGCEFADSFPQIDFQIDQ